MYCLIFYSLYYEEIHLDEDIETGLAVYRLHWATEQEPLIIKPKLKAKSAWQRPEPDEPEYIYLTDNYPQIMQLTHIIILDFAELPIPQLLMNAYFSDKKDERLVKLLCADGHVRKLEAFQTWLLQLTQKQNPPYRLQP